MSAVCLYLLGFTLRVDCLRLPSLRSLQPDFPYYFFPSVGGGAVVSVFKGSFVWGGRMQGFPDKYARSAARGRFIGKRRSRLTLQPT